MMMIAKRANMFAKQTLTTAVRGSTTTLRLFSSQTTPAENVGILGIYTYVPKQFVAQEALEEFDGVGSGKYQIGLGQSKMSFCSYREDINSLALNATSGLMSQFNVDPRSIGRLEVGTETVIDKSKAVKTTLMQLFEQSGNASIEGVDAINACYGGTNALFNALQWIESPYWDGRNAIVVAGDIAVYETGAARPTGGAAMVAMLVGPNAPLAFEHVRGSYFENAYDFYKPNLDSEYPVVDGPLSNDCYTRAVDSCYQLYSERFNARYPQNVPFSLDSFDYTIFHSPYSKLVQKSVARMYYLDFIADPTNARYANSKLHELDLSAISDRTSTYNDRELLKICVTESADAYTNGTGPSQLAQKVIGNSYTGSCYTGLDSLICSETNQLTEGKRVGIFSYGSGLAASLFSARVAPAQQASVSIAEIAQKSNLIDRLEAEREEASPQQFTDTLLARESNGKKLLPPPQGAEELASINKGAFYLHEINAQGVRSYQRV